MNKWCSLWLLVVAFGAWAQTDDITYKGVPLGASIDEYKAKLRDQYCSGTRCSYFPEINCTNFELGRGRIMTLEERQECWQRNSFGGVNVISALAEFREGRLVS